MGMQVNVANIGAIVNGFGEGFDGEGEVRVGVMTQLIATATQGPYRAREPA